MNHQIRLTDYFKKKSAKRLNMGEFKKKKLSLNSKSPIPINNVNIKHENPEYVIDLCSDNDDIVFAEEEDQKFDTTILYTPNITPKTPEKSPNTPPKSNSKNSGSKAKFFSPTKNRRILSPHKAKRSLNKCLIPDTKDLYFDSSFYEYCTGFDDKTIFLLKIVHKYLKDETLRCLLPEDASFLLSKCFEVIKPGMCLVCRLFWRRRGWYRRNDLKKIVDDTCKMNVSNVEIMLQSLVQIGCLESSDTNDSNVSIDLNDYVELLKLEELKEICKEFKLKGQTKQELIKSLKNFSLQSLNISNYFIGPKSNNASRLIKRLKMKAGCCYRLTDRADVAFTKLHYLMYLGIDYSMIREKKLELLLINDKANKETYPIGDDMPLDNASVVFNSSDEFERYFNACTLFERWEAAKTQDEKLEILGKAYDMYNAISEDGMICYKALPPWLRRFTPAYIYVRVIEEGVQVLKKSKEDGISRAVEMLTQLLAQRAFRQSKRADWYAEMALILHNHMGRHDAAAEVLLEGLKSDLSEEAKHAIQPRALKLATMKSNNISHHLREELMQYATMNAIRENDFYAYHIDQKPADHFNNRGKIKFETRSALGERIFLDAEQFCITHYIGRGDFTHGEHWEGRMVTTIFFLLFWDIIYMRLPGVKGIFLTKYYMYPQDLFTDSFYVNRKTLIDERLAMLENLEEDKLLIIMKETWESRPEYERSGIDRSIGWEKVDGVSRCLGGLGVAALCRRLALNYHYANSGFPDLTLWSPTTKQIMFVEVKTDSDKPSVKQLQWLRYLRECGLRAQLCYVGVNTTRQRARGPHVLEED